MYEHQANRQNGSDDARTAKRNSGCTRGGSIEVKNDLAAVSESAICETAGNAKTDRARWPNANLKRFDTVLESCSRQLPRQAVSG